MKKFFIEEKNLHKYWDGYNQEYYTICRAAVYMRCGDEKVFLFEVDKKDAERIVKALNENLG